MKTHDIGCSGMKMDESMFFLQIPTGCMFILFRPRSLFQKFSVFPLGIHLYVYARS